MENLDKPQIITHVDKSLNYTVFDVKWIPCSAKFVSMGMHPRDTGALQVYELSKGSVVKVVEVRGGDIISWYHTGFVLQTEKKNSIKCGTFGAASMHQRHLATGDFAGKLNIW